MGMVLTGRVWKFGDNISTDYMAPSFGLEDPWEIRKKSILHIHETFPVGCRPGDVIVAGKSFGCGSSREEAASNLKRLGIGCIVAESFGRIFFRNCMAIALPVTVCKGVSTIFEEGDRLELDFENSAVKNLDTGKNLKGSPLPTDLLKIVKEGGILALLRNEYRSNAFP